MQRLKCYDQTLKYFLKFSKHFIYRVIINKLYQHTSPSQPYHLKHDAIWALVILWYGLENELKNNSVVTATQC